MSYPVQKPKNAMPARQAELLNFIKSRPAMPSIEEMRQYMGWKNQTSVIDCLDRLVWRRVLKVQVIDGRKVWALEA